MLRCWRGEEIPPAPLYERGSLEIAPLRKGVLEDCPFTKGGLRGLLLYERGSSEIAPLRKGVWGSLQSVVSGVVPARPDL